jgi:hypothetical protein
VIAAGYGSRESGLAESPRASRAAVSGVWLRGDRP